MSIRFCTHVLVTHASVQAQVQVQDGVSKRDHQATWSWTNPPSLSGTPSQAISKVQTGSIRNVSKFRCAIHE
jgi:hypothetical protein